MRCDPPLNPNRKRGINHDLRDDCIHQQMLDQLQERNVNVKVKLSKIVQDSQSQFTLNLGSGQEVNELDLIEAG